MAGVDLKKYKKIAPIVGAFLFCGRNIIFSVEYKRHIRYNKKHDIFRRKM